MQLTEKQVKIYEWLKDRPGYLKKSASTFTCTGSLKDKQIVLSFLKVELKNPIKKVKIIKVITPANLLSVKDFKERNKIFDKMSKANKKIAIAHDVLYSIKKGIINPAGGVYLHLYKNNFGQQDSQKLLCDTNTRCNCCGIGAVFVSKVRLGNNYNNIITSSVGSWEMYDNLNNIFNKKELDKLESHFEGWEDKESKIFKNCEDKSDRMTAIMKNIIKNKGTFKP